MTSRDAESFDHFYGAGYSRVVAELMLLVGSRAEAEDVAQEAFARAWARWARISSFDDPQAWVRRVAYNLTVSRWRALRRAVALRPRLAQLEASSAPETDWVDLSRQLGRLTPRWRQALLLSALQGMTAEEIAEQMRVTPATVRSWLHRARLALRNDGTDAAEPSGLGRADD